MGLITSVLLIIVGLGLLVLVLKIFKTPIKWALKLLLNAVVGYISLFVINFIGGFIGISIGMNWINAVIVGLLGFPGVILLLLVKYLL